MIQLVIKCIQNATILDFSFQKIKRVRWNCEWKDLGKEILHALEQEVMLGRSLSLCAFVSLPINWWKDKVSLG